MCRAFALVTEKTDFFLAALQDDGVRISAMLGNYIMYVILCSVFLP